MVQGPRFWLSSNLGSTAVERLIARGPPALGSKVVDGDISFLFIYLHKFDYFQTAANVNA